MTPYEPYNSREIFSIRKFKAYGAASILLGAALITNQQAVGADELNTGASSADATGESGENGTASSNLETDNLLIQAQPEASLSSSENNSVATTEEKSASASADATVRTSPDSPVNPTTGSEVSERQALITYIVQYLDRTTGRVVHSAVKTHVVTTSDHVAIATVTEHAAELVNESQLANYDLPSGQSTTKTATITEGAVNVISYEVDSLTSTAETSQPRQVAISYTVQYVDKATGQVVHSVVKTQLVTTSDETATAQVNENALELVNASQLDNYYLVADQSTTKTATITEGASNVISYEVEGLASPADREVTISYQVDYVDSETQAVLYSETKTTTFRTEEAVAETTVTEEATRLATEAVLANYKLSTDTKASLTQTIKEQQNNVLVFVLENKDKTLKADPIRLKVTAKYSPFTNETTVSGETAATAIVSVQLPDGQVLTQQADASGSYTISGIKGVKNKAQITVSASLPDQLPVSETVTVGLNSAAPRPKNEGDKIDGGTAVRKVETPVDPSKPYLTLENLTEGYIGVDAMTFAISDQVVNLNFKTGFTRIEASNLELTPDAQAMGLTLDTTSGYIRGAVPLNTLTGRIYHVGFRSKTEPNIVVSIPVTIKSHFGFDIYSDSYAGNTIYYKHPNGLQNGNYGGNSIYNRTGNGWDSLWTLGAEDHTPISERYHHGSVFGSKSESHFLNSDKTVKTAFTYSGFNVTTTPFGYYVGARQTVSDATSTTKQYFAALPIFASQDNAASFNGDKMGLTIADFKVTNVSPGVEINLLDLRQGTMLDRNTYFPSSDFATVATHDARISGIGEVSYGSMTHGLWSTPYYLQFTKLPPTAGRYTATIEITDNLGLKKTFNLNFNTVERSLHNALTNADVLFNKAEDKVAAGTGLVTVPSSTDRQELGTVELNKENAWIKSVEFPPGVVLEATEHNSAGEIIKAKVVKTAGDKLNPGSYQFGVKAVDGHYGDNAPNRYFKFVVLDSLKAIPHKVWAENGAPETFGVELESGGTIQSLRVETTGGYTYMETDDAASTIKAYGLKPTPARQTARVYATYLNGDGTTSETYTDFTYEVTPAPENELTLEVTNPIQTVKEGQTWLNMVITHTDGATLKVDTTKLPRGTRFDPVSKTISGRGLYEGVYEIPIIVEKDLQTKGTTVVLTVEPEQFVVEDEVVTLTVLDDSVPIRFSNIPADATVNFIGAKKGSALHDPTALLAEHGFRLVGGQIVGTPTKYGDFTLEAMVSRRRAGGQLVSDAANLRVIINPLQPSLTATPDRQRFNHGDSQMIPIQLTNDEHSTISIVNAQGFVTPLPEGLEYDSVNKQITGTPTQPGRYTIYLRATLPPELGGYTSTSVVVEAGANMPNLRLTNHEQTLDAGNPITPIVVEARPEANISIDNMYTSTGLTWDPVSRTVTGTPNYKNWPFQVDTQNPGYYVARFTVTGAMPQHLGGERDTATITIRVKDYIHDWQLTNHERTVDIGDAIETISLGSDIPAGSTVSLYPYYDPNNSSSTSSITAENLTNVYGLTFDANTMSFSGTPKLSGYYTQPEVNESGDRTGYYRFKIKTRVTLPAYLGGAYKEVDLLIRIKPKDHVVTVTNKEQEVLVTDEITPIKVTHIDEAAINMYSSASSPGGIYEVGLGNLPEGLSYDPQTGLITGKIKKGFQENGNTPGTVLDTYKITVTSSLKSEFYGLYPNDWSVRNKTETITIKLLPVSPSLDATPAEQEVFVGDEITPIVIDKDPHSEMLFIGDKVGTEFESWFHNDAYLPHGLTYNPDTKTISGKGLAVGTHRITLKTNLRLKETGVIGGESATKEIVLVVKEKPVSLDVTNERQTKQVLTAIDPIKLTPSEGATLSILDRIAFVPMTDVSRLVPGLTYNDVTKTIEGTPTKVGTYTIPVFAYIDGAQGNQEVRKNIVIEVTNLPATLDISNNNQVINLGQNMEGSVFTPGALMSMVIDHPLGEVTIENWREYLEERYGLIYNEGTRTLSGSPTQTGLIRFKVTARHTPDHGGEIAEQYFNLTVNPAGTLPTTPVPNIDAIIEGAQAITGKGIEGATINVTLPDGTQKQTTVTGGVWRIEATAPFVKGENVIVSQFRPGHLQ